MSKSLTKLDSILYNLPFLLEKRQAIIFDGMRNAFDMIALSYDSLESLLTEFSLAQPLDAPPIPLMPIGNNENLLRIQALSHITVFINNLKTLKQIYLKFTQSDVQSPLKTLLLKEEATKLRDVVQHLPDNIGNLAKKTGRLTPLFGNIGWFFSRTGHNDKIMRYVINSGILHAKKTDMMNIPAPSEKTENQAYCIEYQVDKNKINLSTLFNELSEAFRTLETAITHEINKEISKNDTYSDEQKATAPILIYKANALKPHLDFQLRIRKKP